MTDAPTYDLDYAIRLIEAEKQARTGSLDIGNCGLTEIPEEVLALHWLERLNLGLGFFNKNGEWESTENEGGRNTIVDLTLLHGLKYLVGLGLAGNRDFDKSSLTELTRLESLTLNGCEVSVNDLSLLKKLEKLQYLNLSNNSLHGEDLVHLNDLIELTSLDLGYNQISSEHLVHLSDLTKLTSLDLGYNQISGEHLVHMSGLTKLTSLYLWNNQISGEHLAHLSDLTRLTSLNLWGNQISGEHLVHLSGLMELTNLILGNNRISGEHLLHLSGFRRLENLHLSSNQISGEHLAHLSGLTELTSLDLGYNQISDEHLVHLSSLTRLENLYLSSNQLIGEHLGHLSDLAGLTSLDLGTNQISGEHLVHLSGLTGLTSLDLGTNQISGEHLVHLSGLTELTSLDLGTNQISDEHLVHLSSLTRLENLHLSSNQLNGEHLGHLSDLAGLTSLDLGTNQISGEHLVHLSGLTGLMSLNLKSNQISGEHLSHLSSLTVLTSLDLSTNQISGEHLVHLVNLTGLTSLDLGRNQISGEHLVYLVNLTGLTSLGLGSNQISSEHLVHLSGLTRLTNLNLALNQINDEHLYHLSSLTVLTSLNLGWNQISGEHLVHLSGLKGLTSLGLGSNQISGEHLVHLSGMSNLTSLNLWSNQISGEHLSHLSGLTGLTSLNLGWNQISGEHLVHLSGLAGLTSLELWSNQVSGEDLVHLSGLTGLTSLYLWSNQISGEHLSHLSGLTRLEDLHLSSNQISGEYLVYLSDMTGLARLYLDSNQISGEHLVHLSGMTGLTSLGLGSNQISGEDLEHLNGLTGLTSLDLGTNQISGKHLVHLSGLTSLTRLDLGSNQISGEYLDYLLGLIRLQELDLSENEISNYDRLQVLRELPLEELNLYGNPIRKFPRALLGNTDYDNNSLSNTYAWLDAIADPTRCVYQTTFKLLLIGNGNTGKTSLFEALRDGTAQPKSPADSTHGIALETLPLGPATAHVWDFAGQEIFHGTHRLFLRGESVILVVFDSATEEKAREYQATPDRVDPEREVRDHPLRYWLQLARDQAPESRIILVQNKCEAETMLDANAKALATEFGVPFLTVSAHRGRQIDRLRSQLLTAASELNEYQMLIPRSWKAMRDSIVANQALPAAAREKQIDKAVFTERCVTAEVLPASVPALLTFLDNSGFLYHLSDSEIILDQEWALQAIYSLLQRDSAQVKELRTEKKGRATARWVFSQFGEMYSEEQRWMFIEFMQQCGICFPLNDGNEHQPEALFLFPEYLPAEPSTTAALFLDGGLGLQVRQFRRRLPFADNTRVQRLIARVGRKTAADNIWRRGIFIPTAHAGIGLFYSEWTEGYPYLHLYTTAEDPAYWLELINELLRETKFQQEELSVWEVFDNEEWTSLPDTPGVTKRKRDDPTSDQPESPVEPKKQLDKLADVDQSGRYEVVISYAAEDREVVEDFVSMVNIKLMKKKYHPAFNIWYDRNQVANRTWPSQIAERFERAGGFLIFTSRDYCQQQRKTYIWENEVPVIRRRLEKDGVPVCCVAARRVVDLPEELEDFYAFRDNDYAYIPDKDTPAKRDDFLARLIEQFIKGQFLKENNI